MNPEISSRLQSCFLSVFPDLTEGEVFNASMTSMEKWDSLAMVTLVSVVEDEFEVEITDAELQNFVTFKAIAEILGSKNRLD